MSWVEYLSYNPDNGIFTWKKSPSKCAVVGSVAGTFEASGYLRIRLKGKSERGHRLAWLLTHGYLPTMIDHIDRNKSNNRLENLREATDKTNSLNKSVSGRSVSGEKGVWFDTSRGKWKWQVTLDGRTTCGTATTLESARFAATKCREALHKDFACHA